MVPPVMEPLVSNRPMKLLVNTLLPEPDSPTTASTSPRYRSRSMPRMACSTRPRRLNRISSPRTERMQSFSFIMHSSLLQVVLRVGGVRERVADQIERNGDKAQNQGGVEQLVAQTGLHHHLAAVVDQIAQRGRLHREA